jgi:hypothetical protein
MTAGMILFAVISGLAINEFCELSSWVARKLVRWSAHRCYTNPHRARDRADELEAAIDTRPGTLVKLSTALGIATAAIAVCVSRAVARRVPAPVRQLARPRPRSEPENQAFTIMGHRTVIQRGESSRP